MIRKAKASMEFIQFPVADKVAFGNDVIQGLTDNVAIFATPDVTVAALTTANNDLEAKATAASTGAHAAVQAMYNSEQSWNTKFRADANYVSRIADGDKEKILLSGYRSTKTEVDPLQAPGPVQNVVVTLNGAGKLKVKIDKLPEAKMYLYMVLHSADGSNATLLNDQLQMTGFNGWFSIIADTKTSAEFDGLTSGDNAGVEVIAVNSAGLGPIIQPVDVVVP